MSDIERKTVEIHEKLRRFFARCIMLILGMFTSLGSAIKCAMLAVLKFIGHMGILAVALVAAYMFYLTYKMGGPDALEFVYLKLHYIVSTGKLHP